jgi:hypothetical protein
MIIAATANISLNGIKQLIFVMVKCVVFFEVRTGLLNTIQTRFGFEGLTPLTFLASCKGGLVRETETIP